MMISFIQPEPLDGDHIKPWSKGGKTDESNCQRLRKRHNNAKRDVWKHSAWVACESWEGYL